MTTEEMKALYEANPAEWIPIKIENIYLNGKHNNTKYYKEEIKYLGHTYINIKLIHIKHKDILEAYLADNSVEIEFLSKEDLWFPATFIENYNPDLEYRLKETTIKHIIKDGSRSHVISYNEHGEKCSEPNCEINRLKEKEDANKIRISNTNTNTTNDRNSSSDNKINNFQEYEFTADFEGEILKEIKVGDDCIATGRYMGWIRIGNNEMFMVEWWSDGMCRNYYKEIGDLKDYNLTPIKKEWYEDSDVRYKF